MTPPPIVSPEPAPEPASSVDGPAPRESPWGKRARAGAAAAILVVAVLWALHGVDVAAVRRALALTRPGWIAAAAAVNLVAVGFQAARWLALVKPLSRSVTLASAFQALVVGNAVSVVVPARAGELARIQWFARRTDLPRPSILGSIGLDFLVNAATLALGLMLAPLILPVPTWLRRAVVVIAAVIVAAVLVLRRLRSVAGETPGREASGPLKRLGDVLARARHGLAATGDARALTMSVVASIGSWFVEVIVIALTFRAMGLDLPWRAAVAALIGVNVALAIPFAPPGNAGTLEAGATLGLVGFGVGKEQALAFALMYHLLQVVPIGILGALFAGRAARRS
jgi:uncharacterized protein (TIRG00374 family)